MHNFYRKVPWIREKGRLFLKGKTLYSSFYEKKSIKNLSPSFDLIKREVLIENNPIKSKSWIFKELQYFDFLWIYLHGSQSDGTSTSFSDYDDLIIVDTNELNSKNFKKVTQAFNKVDMRFCRLDYLQHHGHWIIAMDQLQTYNESYMPLSVLTKSEVINGPREIKYIIDTKGTYDGLRKNIIRTVQNIETLYEEYNRGKINLYKLKGLIGSFVLIPPMLFQLKGIAITKPEAIKKSNELFDNEAIKCIEWASFCRNNWKETERFLKVKAFKRIVFLYKNPFKYREFARLYSPVIKLDKIGFDNLKEGSVKKFNQTVLNLLELKTLPKRLRT